MPWQKQLLQQPNEGRASTSCCSSGGEFVYRMQTVSFRSVAAVLEEIEWSLPHGLQRRMRDHLETKG